MKSETNNSKTPYQFSKYRIPAFYCLLALYLSTLLAFCIFDRLTLSQELYNYSFTLSTIFIVISILLSKFFYMRITFVIIAGIFLSIHIAKKHNEQIQFSKILQSINEKESVITGVIKEDSKPWRNGYSSKVTLVKISQDTKEICTNGNIIIRTDQPIATLDTINASGKFFLYSQKTKFRPVASFTVKNLIKQKSKSNIVGLWLTKSRYKCHSILNAINDPFKSALILALVLGDKSALPIAIQRDFRNGGLSHIMAISGLHVGILAASIMLILSFLPISRSTKVIATILFLLFYNILVGALPSLFRASVTTGFIIISFSMERKIAPLNALGVAGIIWILYSPTSIFSPGFQLSFSATIGIITLFPILRNFYYKPAPKNLFKKISFFFLDSIMVSIAGTIFTAPIVLFHFGKLPLISILLNIAAVPLLGIIMNLAFFGLLISFLYQPIGLILLESSGFTADLLMRCAEITRFANCALIQLSINNAIYPMLSFLLLLLTLLSPPQIRKVAIVGTLLIFILQLIIFNPIVQNFSAQESVKAENECLIKIGKNNCWYCNTNTRKNKRPLINKIHITPIGIFISEEASQHLYDILDNKHFFQCREVFIITKQPENFISFTKSIEKLYGIRCKAIPPLTSLLTFENDTITFTTDNSAIFSSPIQVNQISF